MEVWYLQTYYDECHQYDSILLHIPDTDYWFEASNYNDYETVCQVHWTPKFWESVEMQQEDMLTYLGTL